MSDTDTVTDAPVGTGPGLDEGYEAYKAEQKAKAEYVAAREAEKAQVEADKPSALAQYEADVRQFLGHVGRHLGLVAPTHPDDVA